MGDWDANEMLFDDDQLPYPSQASPEHATLTSRIADPASEVSDDLLLETDQCDDFTTNTAVGNSHVQSVLLQDPHASPESPDQITSEKVTATKVFCDSSSVISRIEDIFESFADCLLNQDGDFTIVLKNRSPSSLQQVAGDDEVTSSRTAFQTIRFPGKSGREAWKFSMFSDLRIHGQLRSNGLLAATVRILELIHEALLEDVVITKR